MTDQVTEETEIFSIRPSMRGYAVVIIFGVVTLPFMGLGAILIIMAWLKTKSAAYRMTTQRLFTRDGILSRSVNEMELYRVKDVSYSQGFIQRMLGVGHVLVVARDSTTPVLEITNIKEPEKIKELIRSASRSARKSEGVSVREYAV